MDIDIEENIFFDEVMNKLQSLESSLYLAKDGTDDQEVINEIFRSIHTVKGVCDLLGFMDIVKLTHKAEDLLDEIRSKKIQFIPSIYYILMELKGFISTLVKDALRGKEMDPSQRSIYDSFFKDIHSNLPKSILILENEPLAIENIHNIVQNSTHKITTQTKLDTNHIQMSFDSANVKMIIFDVEQISQDIFMLIHEMKKKHSSLNVVLAVKNIDQRVKSSAKILGAKAWIKKPFQQTELNTLIEKIL